MPNGSSKVIGDEGVRAIYEMGLEGVEIIRERGREVTRSTVISAGVIATWRSSRVTCSWFEETQREEAAAGYPHTLTLLDATEVKQYVGSEAFTWAGSTTPPAAVTCTP